MMGVTCAALSTAQSDRPLRIEQHGDTQRPAIAVFLPGSKFPSAVIEMPEHAWRKDATPPPKLIERLDGVTRYFKSKAADAAIIATESTPSGWIAATHGLYCPSLFTNPARTCHHADPQALSLATGKARLRLKVYFLKGSVERAFDLVLKRDRNGDC